MPIFFVVVTAILNLFGFDPNTNQGNVGLVKQTCHRVSPGAHDAFLAVSAMQCGVFV